MIFESLDHFIRYCESKKGWMHIIDSWEDRSVYYVVGFVYDAQSIEQQFFFCQSQLKSYIALDKKNLRRFIQALHNPIFIEKGRGLISVVEFIGD